MSDFQTNPSPGETDPMLGETENTLAIIAPLLRPAADATAVQVRSWFDASLVAALPLADGSLATERSAAAAYAQLGKAENTRRAYRAAVRMWCAWCERRGLSPLPATGPDVAAFLASERLRGLTPETLKLRRAAI
ncbi:MAG: site-specific integrase, partial [Janthinobacterium lividum]